MNSSLVVRNAYVSNSDDVLDIAVSDGRIERLEPTIDEEGDTELDAEGRLVSPGLVDAHVHLDMAFSATGERLPRNNTGGADRTERIDATAAYFADTERKAIEANARAAAERAIENGVLHVRTHAYVDGTVGTEVVEAVAAVREALRDRIDIEIVAFPQCGIHRDDGSAEAVRDALDVGADLVGGLDPATRNGDRVGTIATWFDIATAHDADLDVHIHERGTTGMDTLEALAEEAVERDDGRVTASHAYALADAATDSSQRLDDLMAAFGRANLDCITCYQSTPHGMPIRRFHDAGLAMAHGTDQVHDLWGAHGNVDALEAALVESLKLDYSTNEGLATLWDCITEQGARVLDLDGYAIEPGTPADLVVHESDAPPWAIVENRTPRYVLKNGRVVAEDGQSVRCYRRHSG